MPEVVTTATTIMEKKLSSGAITGAEFEQMKKVNEAAAAAQRSHLFHLLRFEIERGVLLGRSEARRKEPSRWQGRSGTRN